MTSNKWQIWYENNWCLTHSCIASNIFKTFQKYIQNMVKHNEKPHMYNKKWKTAADVVVENQENNICIIEYKA